MKIMLYCQHVLGIGHFFRSMEIAADLRGREVLFVEGGDPLPGFVPPAHVRRLVLPAMMMDSQFRSMHAREGELDEVRQKRAGMLSSAFDSFAPDVLITELFPFGRRQFRFELTPVLEAARKRGVLAVCSLRDILVEKEHRERYESWVVDNLNRYYGLLLIHSDPAIVALDETFARVSDISVPVEYTGYVARPGPGAPRNGRGSRTVVASSGGGGVGADLLSASIIALKAIPGPEFSLRAFIGPFMSAAEREHLESLAAGDPRISLRPFTLDFRSELAGAGLSVSMAGYNTCMDILSTRTPALVYPFPQNREQSLRARKLEEAGLLRVIRKLDPETIRTEILNGLASPAYAGPPSRNPDLDGAKRTAALIEKYFGRN